MLGGEWESWIRVVPKEACLCRTIETESRLHIGHKQIAHKGIEGRTE